MLVNNLWETSENYSSNSSFSTPAFIKYSISPAILCFHNSFVFAVYGQQTDVVAEKPHGRQLNSKVCSSTIVLFFLIRVQYWYYTNYAKYAVAFLDTYMHNMHFAVILYRI